MERQEINIQQSDIRKIILSIVLPILFTFIIEHFGEFRYTGYGDVSYSEFRVNNLTFETPFGNTISENVYDKNIGYTQKNDGSFVLNGTYSGKLPYYIKGLMKDILYPLIVSFISIVVISLSRKFKININNDDSKTEKRKSNKKNKLKKKRKEKKPKNEFPIQ